MRQETIFHRPTIDERAGEAIEIVNRAAFAIDGDPAVQDDAEESSRQIWFDGSGPIARLSRSRAKTEPFRGH